MCSDCTAGDELALSHRRDEMPASGPGALGQYARFAPGRRPALYFNRRQDNFFFAASGTSTFVVPTSLSSTVVVRSWSISFPFQFTLPLTLNSYFVSAPSFTQNF